MVKLRTLFLLVKKNDKHIHYPSIQHYTFNTERKINKFKTLKSFKEEKNYTVNTDDMMLI
jgi:hypothetical protein